MKKALGIILAGIILASMATTAKAKSSRERKNKPESRNAVAEAVKAAGEKHFPEKMKIGEVGSIKMKTTYYHVYCGALRKGNYHIIVFDNTPKYLGYYYTEFEPTGYEEGAILFDVGGAVQKIEIRETGPQDNTRLADTSVKFIKAPKKKEPAFAKPEAEESSDDSAIKPEFREWTITLRGKKHKVRALYISQKFAKVTLRGEASAKERTFTLSSISKEDQEYVKQFEK